MAPIHSIIALFACLIAGCATTCNNTTFYKPSIVGDAKSTLSWTNNRVFVDLADGLSISVLECGRARQIDYRGPASICVQFLIDSGHRLVVFDPAILIQNESSQIIGIGVPKPWNVADEVGSPIVLAHVPIELVGGVDRNYSSLERTLSKVSGWKKYNMSFDVPKTDAREIYVELPSMLLDKSVVTVPRFRFRQVTEDVCYTSV